VRTRDNDGRLTWKSTDLPLSPQAKGKKRRLWWITGPFSSGTSSDTAKFPIFMDSVFDQFMTSDRWPACFKAYYTCDYDAIACTRLWSFLKKDDLARIAKETNDEWRRLDREAMGGEAPVGSFTEPEPSQAQPEAEESDYVDSRRLYEQHFALLDYLSGKSLPATFLVATAQSEAADEGCTNSITPTFSYYMRALVLDVAVFENTSGQPIDIASLVGVRTEDEGLSSNDGSFSVANAAPLGDSGFSLPPGAKVIVPLRIGFPDALDEWRSPSRLQVSDRMYDRIKAKPAKTVFDLSMDLGGTSTRVRKVRRSFPASEVPPLADYAYGPQTALAGFATADDTASFQSTSPSPVALTDAYRTMRDAEEGAVVGERVMVDETGRVITELNLHSAIGTDGSCPILYTYDAETGEWVNRGKVIHTARERENEATEVVEVDPSVRRVRLSEEEPEVTHLRRVLLTLTLRDGRSLTYLPRESYKPRRDGYLLRLPAYTQVEFNFDVPPLDHGAAVVKAELSITGYYRRYSSMQSAKVRP
jgi:hypothetical protein